MRLFSGHVGAVRPFEGMRPLECTFPRHPMAHPGAQGHHLREEGLLQIGRNLCFRFGLYLRQLRLVGEATALKAEDLKFTSSPSHFLTDLGQLT